MGGLEKNWSPFSSGGALFVRQWLDNDGSAVALRLDPATGLLVERFETSSAGLRAALGAAPHAVISGGTPAVRLNSTHQLAVGHTMTSPCNRPATLRGGAAARDSCFRGRGTWYRAYAQFAYVFADAPPFAIAAATPEFRLRPALPARRAGGFASAETAAHALKGFVNDTTVQFPVGLMLDRTRGRVELSWGYADRESMLSVMPLASLLRRLTRLRPEAEAPRAATHHRS